MNDVYWFDPDRIQPPRIHKDRPWMTALEIQFASLAIVRKLWNDPAAPHSVTDVHVLNHLPHSTPFAWSEQTIQAVWMASRSIPGDAIFSTDLLPDGLRSAFWWLGEWPIPLVMKYPKKEADDFGDIDTHHICAILISLDDRGFWLISCARMSNVGFPFMIEVNQVGIDLTLEALSDPNARTIDRGNGVVQGLQDRDIALLRFILGAGVWMRQRIVSVTSGHIERHRRKQIAREHGVSVSDVKVIELRRQETFQTLDASGDPAEWSCRWIVNGHWRNQSCKEGHKLIYILPYVKGPEDKPLRVPSHTAYIVDR